MDPLQKLMFQYHKKNVVCDYTSSSESDENEIETI
jgi:hypothetical protein